MDPTDRQTRTQRYLKVLDQRLAWVRCAVEHVHHRHNASAILRSCDAIGVHHVHMVGDAWFQPSRGPARGAWRWLTLHRHTHTREAIDALRADGVQLWVADLSDSPTAPADVPLDRPVCLWFGAEMLGVSDEARAAADGVVTVPMRGFAQSLNVSVAAALALHVVAERARREVGDDALLPRPERDALLARWLARDDKDAHDLDGRHRAARALGRALGPVVHGTDVAASWPDPVSPAPESDP
ncbi:MAG: RNA methyltransferase [Alphaproteobacteria bacterium]|nr:RNA methyltransferase [Alphaproteobacteria bacterium]